MGLEEGSTKKHTGFCESGKCSVVIFVLVAIGIAVVACVTFLFPAVRTTVPPTETPTTTLTWWQTTIIYQVYPRSFRDSNGDGVGDLKGVIEKLSYFNDLGVGAVWLSPFFTSPMRDFGYDVSNYTEVDKIFGNMADFDELIRTAHEKDIKIIIDFVPNHTSNESTWFKDSRNSMDQYKDFYIWNAGKTLPNGTHVAPNKWISVFEGSSWTWDDVRKEYYYHAFLDSQPDLNYRNPAVRAAMKDVLRFWLNKGVDGFRIDAIPHLFEHVDLSLEERPGMSDAFDPDRYKYTKNQPEIFDVVREWREVLNQYEGERFLVAETVGIPQEERQKYYEAGSVPFFFDLIPVARGSRGCPNTLAQCYLTRIIDGMNLKGAQWPNFVIGNHDNRRIADRIGQEYADAMNMMLLTLPGTPTSYYGEELGMRGGNYTGFQPKDPFAITSNNPNNSRDSERNPMQWSNTVNAGFMDGTGEPWLKITANTEYPRVNVEEEGKVNGSSLQLYKELAQLRARPGFRSTHIGTSCG
ncbi:maltase A2-like isoform X2 [Dreissena polymorpha]|uniref:maltase A2-like isoform X2 n=1 Tax=Dreissena polymorpha TaxID=45954 RepID=UPI002263EE9C|nr:maltase A2-like isoform X2 [Dreissena polymorpha]